MEKRLTIYKVQINTVRIIQLTMQKYLFCIFS